MYNMDSKDFSLLSAIKDNYNRNIGTMDKDGYFHTYIDYKAHNIGVDEIRLLADIYYKYPVTIKGEKVQVFISEPVINKRKYLWVILSKEYLSILQKERYEIIEQTKKADITEG